MWSLRAAGRRGAAGGAPGIGHIRFIGHSSGGGFSGNTSGVSGAGSSGDDGDRRISASSADLNGPPPAMPRTRLLLEGERGEGGGWSALTARAGAQMAAGGRGILSALSHIR